MSTAEAPAQPPEQRAERGLAKEAAWAYLEPRGPLDLRGRTAALRPAEGQPRVLRRPRLLGLRHRLASRSCWWRCRRRCCSRSSCSPAWPARPPGACAHVVLLGRARGADRGSGAQEVDRRLRPGPDRPVARDRRRRWPCSGRAPSRCARSSTSSRRSPLVFLGALPVQRLDLGARLPRRGQGAHDRRRHAGGRSWSCCSTSCRRTRSSTRRASSTPSASRASASSPRTPPGSRTPTRSTTPPSARSRRSWTATCPRRTSSRSRPTTRTASSRCSARRTGMNVSEEATTVCSRDLCDDERLDESYGSRMSSMTEDLGLVWLHVVVAAGHRVRPHERVGELGQLRRRRRGGAGRARPRTGPRARTRAGEPERRPAGPLPGVDRLDPSPAGRPPLNFKHTLLPHVPWQYLPSGRRYRRQPNDVIPGLSNQAYEDQGQLDVLLQRHVSRRGSPTSCSAGSGPS